MRGVDLGIDHGDHDIVAPDHAVNVGDLELLQDVLRRVPLRAVRGGRGFLGLLLQAVDVVRLRDRDELDGR